MLLVLMLSVSQLVWLAWLAWLGGTAASCVSHCPAQAAWSYQAGRQYSYQYSVTATTAMRGTSDRQSALSFSATATIANTSPCNFVLKVSHQN